MIGGSVPFVHARPPRRRPRVPLRPRRRAHRHRQRPRRGVEADVRRLPARPRRAGRHAVPAVRRQGRLRPLRRRPPAAGRHPRLPRLARHRRCPRARRTTRRTPRRVRGLATRKNDLVQEKIRTVGVDVYPGSVRYLQRRAGRGPAHGVRVVVGQRRAGAARSPGSADLYRPPGRRGGRQAARPARQARARHVPRRRGRPRRAPRSRPSSSRTRWPASRPGRAGGFGFVVGVDRVGQADALREHGADVVVDRPRGAAAAERRESTDESRSRTPVHRRAVARARADARHGRARRSRVGVRAVQRPHRAARQPRRGRAARHARHLPQLVLRAAAAAVRRGRVRLPRVRPDDHQRHQRQADPAAGGRRAVRPALRRAAPPRAGARPAGGHADPRGRVGLARRAARCKVRSERLVSLTQRAVAAIRYEVEVARRPGAARRAVRAGGQRAAARAAARRPARRGGARPTRWSSEQHAQRRRPARCWSTRPASPGCGWPPRWTTRSTGPTSSSITSEATRGHRPHHRDHAGCSPASGCAWSSTWPTAGRRAAVAARRARPGRAPRSPAARYTGWDGLLGRAARRTSTSSGPPPTSRSTATPSCSRPSASRSSTCCRPGARAERRRDRRQGPDRRRATTATPSGTPRPSCLPVLTLHSQPDAAADALRWRQSILPLARERAEQLGLRGRGVPVADDPRPGVLGLLAGRARPRSTSTPTSPTPSRRYVAATGDAEFEREVGLELLVETARLWRSLGHHDSRGSFRIDGVTGPDEYTAIVDNNVYTNLMAQLNLRVAADAAAEHRAGRARLGRERRGDGAAGATRRTPMRIPFDEVLGVHPQSRGLHPARSAGTSRTPRPSTTRCCCTTRTSTSTASRSSSRPTWCWRCSCGRDAFTPEQKARNFAYYEALTVRDSSLSACTQAVIAAEVGHLDLAYDYLAEAALDRPERPGGQHRPRRAHRVAGGHLDRASSPGSAACSATATGCAFAPRLPPALSRISFGLSWHGRQLRVEIHRRRRSTGWSAARRCGCRTTASRSRWPTPPRCGPIPPAEPVEPVRAAVREGAPGAPPRRLRAIRWYGRRSLLQDETCGEGDRWHSARPAARLPTGSSTSVDTSRCSTNGSTSVAPRPRSGCTRCCTTRRSALLRRSPSETSPWASTPTGSPRCGPPSTGSRSGASTPRTARPATWAGSACSTRTTSTTRC